MGIETLVMLMLIALVVMAWYANYSKRSKIYCTFNRVNKTQISKFVKMTSRYVISDNRRYDILPNCIVFKWWDTGLANWLFPQWVATLTYTYNNRLPHDPNTNKPAIVSPEVRNAMNKEEWLKSYAKSFTPPKAIKQTFIQQYLPYVSMVLIIFVGFWMYNNMQSFAEHLNYMQNILDNMTK